MYQYSRYLHSTSFIFLCKEYSCEEISALRVCICVFDDGSIIPPPPFFWVPERKSDRKVVGFGFGARLFAI